MTSDQISPTIIKLCPQAKVSGKFGGFSGNFNGIRNHLREIQGNYKTFQEFPARLRQVFKFFFETFEKNVLARYRTSLGLLGRNRAQST